MMPLMVILSDFEEKILALNMLPFQKTTNYFPKNRFSNPKT